MFKKTRKIWDVADVATEFYTEDNLHFIKAANKDVKGSNNYENFSDE